jgi:hypothetical protein
MRILFALFLLILSLQVSFGQNFQENENWIGEIEGYPHPELYHNFKTFSKEDVIKAKEKLSLIRQSSTNDEWEGYYQQYGELSQIGLIWNNQSGFIDYYIYTCSIELRGLGFGNVTNSAESILLNYEKPRYITKKMLNRAERTLVKVKIGERHYLVPEDRIKDFCEYAVGRLFGQKEYETSVRYWWKVSDDNNKSESLPILSDKYAKFVVKPVEAKIIKVGKVTIENRETNEDKIESGDIYHFITIDAGKNQNVKKGMNLYIPEIDETAIVEKVSLKSSVAIIYRDFYETRTERCWDEKHEIKTCPKINVGMYAKTKGSF